MSSKDDPVKQMEKEILKVRRALELDLPTSTKQGMREYKRVQRKVEKATRQKGSRLVSRWGKAKKVFQDFWDWEIEV